MPSSDPTVLPSFTPSGVPTNAPAEFFSSTPSNSQTESSSSSPSIIGGCIVAGEAAQLLSLVDGSQRCRPYTTDGLSVDLVDLSEGDIDHCGPCGESLKCPLDNASCGDSDSMLICHFEGGGDIPNKDLCTPASVFPMFVEMKGNTGHPLDFCGCCDGFAQSLPVDGKCSSIGFSTGSLDPEPFNACCNPCRDEVPEEFRPCCCQKSGKCTDASQLLLRGYGQCESNEPSQAPSVIHTTIPTNSNNVTMNATSTIPATQVPIVANQLNSSETVAPSKSPTNVTVNFTATNSTIAPVLTPTNVGATSQPTIVPSLKTTLLPTKKPTVAHFAEPTKAPTKIPSFVPIIKPTKAPTKKPTFAPSKTTNVLTKKPILVTKSPMEEPTSAPIVKPTKGPTKKPTLAPTGKPTQAPENQPTNRPTEKPTEVPTDNPTKSPTKEPSDMPTAEPTILARTLFERTYRTDGETVSTTTDDKPDQKMNPIVSLTTLIIQGIRWLLR